MSAPVITAVQPGSGAAEAGLQPGDEILTVNGVVPRDVIEWQVAVSDDEVDLEVRRGAVERSVTVRTGGGQRFGADISSAVFDRVRTCDNHCEFCFIYQLPKGMRRSLYLKDDDYRLSFLYGNFTTLTRFTEADLERVVTDRLSPLHVSIHATDPQVRASMLKNRRGAMSLRWLRALLDHGIEVRGQIVVCPGVNDAAVLDRTLAGVLDEYPELESLAVVPLGVSRFNREAAMREHTLAEAQVVVDLVERWQETFSELLGRPMVFAADEYYLMAERPFPAAARYGEFSMHEDGIGMARAFEAEFTGATSAPIGPRRGFFAAVDVPPPNPAAYTGLRASTHGSPLCGDAARAETVVQLRPRRADAARRGGRTRPTVVLTSPLGERVLRPLLDANGFGAVQIASVENRFFGGNTAVTGLMVGADIRRVLDEQPADRRFLLPDVCLSDDGRFLDDVHVADLGRPVEVIHTDGIALRAALEEAA